MTDIVERLANNPGYIIEGYTWINAEWVSEARAEIERLREALHRIRSWSEAYPVDIFPEPDLKKARALLAAGGITLDAVSAYCMRHCIDGVGKIARGALRHD